MSWLGKHLNILTKTSTGIASNSAKDWVISFTIVFFPCSTTVSIFLLSLGLASIFPNFPRIFNFFGSQIEDGANIGNIDSLALSYISAMLRPEKKPIMLSSAIAKELLELQNTKSICFCFKIPKYWHISFFQYCLVIMTFSALRSINKVDSQNQWIESELLGPIIHENSIVDHWDSV